MSGSFLLPTDLTRALGTLRKFARHDISAWALTGGLAIELYVQLSGQPGDVRNLNDIDFVVESFDQIPAILSDDFIFRHIHPLDPANKIILQCIDPASALRIDVFRAPEAILDRSRFLMLGGSRIRAISLDDLVARLARLTLDLFDGVPTASKYASDFLRLEKLVNPSQVESVWNEHRKEGHPASFADARNLLRQLIPAHPELLITPEYSADAAEVCRRCVETASFRLADRSAVRAILGYC